MAFRGDKRNDYTEATALLTKLDVYTTNMFWDGLVPGLVTLNHFWSRAIEWENTMLIAKKVGLPSCINELPTLTQRLVKILEPNVEHIRSRIIERDEDNHKFFVWLDEVLVAAGSPPPGQFMAPILVRRRQEVIVVAAKAFAGALDLSDLPPSVANRLLLVFEKALVQGLTPDVSEKTRIACLEQRCKNLQASLLAWKSLPQAKDG